MRYSALVFSFLSTSISILHLVPRVKKTIDSYRPSTDFRQFEQYLNVTGLDVGNFH
jgi:hypothetical protein